MTSHPRVELQESAPEYVSLLRGVIGGLVDLTVNGSCGDQTAMPPTFGAVSIGFAFKALPVQIDAAHPVVTVPEPASCLDPGDAGVDDGG